MLVPQCESFLPSCWHFPSAEANWNQKGEGESLSVCFGTKQGKEGQRVYLEGVNGDIQLTLIYIHSIFHYLKLKCYLLIVHLHYNAGFGRQGIESCRNVSACLYIIYPSIIYITINGA